MSLKVLFLDRDGVINVENEGSYILSIPEFHFYDGVIEAIRNLQSSFDKIIVVTNQRCIGKGLITIDEMDALHQYMISEIVAGGGRIDNVYYAPALESDNKYRKPNNGMLEWVETDFGNIDYQASWMVGNNLSDMKFGKSKFMSTCFLTTTNPSQVMPNEWIDVQFDSLLSFSKEFNNIKQ